LQRIHGEGRAPASIVLRRELITRRDAGGPSPAVQLITPRGHGLSLYLTALFDAQSRRHAGTQIRNFRPLLSTGNDVGWTDLLPAVTAASDTDAGKLRQIHRALTALERIRLVELRRPGRTGRYEEFKLLPESGGGIRGRTGYVIPTRAAAAEDRLLEIPASFFLRGWAHVLLPADIVVYFVMLDLRTQLQVETVYVADSVKDQMYSITRDVYEHHRALSAYGLLHRLDDDDRSPDGKIARGPLSDVLPFPYRFRLIRRGLDRDALPVVSNALTQGW
jgi:hypothetical protein